MPHPPRIPLDLRYMAMKSAPQPRQLRREILLLVAFLLGGTLLSGSGCTLRYDFSECDTNRDCARIENPATGELYQCVQNECVPRHVDTLDARDESDDTNGADSEESNACTSTRQCLDAFGDAYYCTPDGECLDSAHQFCEPIYYANNERGEIALLGSIIPTQGAAYSGVGTTIRNAVRMAVIEYASNALTLPNGATVAHLHCEGGSPEIARASAEHMRALGVPFIVGPLTSTSFIDVVRHVSAQMDDQGVAPNPMSTVALGATATAIANLDAIGKYAFQLIPQDTMQASAIVDRTHDLRWRSCVLAEGDPECTDDTSCQANPLWGTNFVFDPDKPEAPCKMAAPKITVFYKDDHYGNGMHDLFVDRYYDRYGEAQLKYYKYPDPASLNFDETRIRTKFTSIVIDALSGDNAQPDSDLVIFVGTGEATALAQLYVSALSNIGGQMAPMQRRYIFSHGAAADAPTIFEGPNALPEALMPQFEAISPNIFNEPLFSKWQNRYALTFNEPTKTSVGGLGYDAAYLGIFAMAGVPSAQKIDGHNVSAVIESGRLQTPEDQGGTVIELEGTTFPGAARQALRDGKDIDMIGVSGDLNFVIKEGENKGTVRANIMGLNIMDTNDDGVLEVVPTRMYLLDSDEDFGHWTPLAP